MMVPSITPTLTTPPPFTTPPTFASLPTFTSLPTFASLPTFTTTSSITTTKLPISHDVLGITSSDSRFQLVNSLYGPGTVGCWLLIICSVITSWTLNPREKKLDHITNDFIASLTFPCIASAHLAFLLYRLPAPLLEVLTSPDLGMLQHAAAIEAPLNICETFSMLALLLFAIAAWRLQVKRAVLILIVGVLSWNMVNSVFFESQAKNTERRPLSLDEGSINHEAMIEFGWIILCMVLLPIILLIALTGTCIILWLKPTGVISALSTPVACLAAFLVTSGLLADEGPIFTSRPFFIPRTGLSMQSLDQIVALCGGGVTLLFSLLEAFKEDYDSSTNQEENPEEDSVQLVDLRHGTSSGQHILAQRRSSI